MKPASLHPPGDPGRGWILYDGDCGVCSRWVPAWAPTLSRLGFAIAPLQSPWVEQRTGIAGEALASDIRLLHPDGSMLSGAEVYRYLMRRLWWAYPFYLLARLPVLSAAFDWGYRTFARHRGRISTACGLPGTGKAL